VVGTILLIAITVALAAVVATLVSGLGGRGTPPSVMVTVTAENSAANTVRLTISHEGGDDLVVKDLDVKATNSITGAMSSTSGSALETALAVGPVFTVGESGSITYTYDNVADGTVLTVYIIHVPSKQKLFSAINVVVR